MPDDAAEQHNEPDPSAAETEPEPASPAGEAEPAGGKPDNAPAGPPEGKQEEFDAKRAQEKIRKANSEAAGLRKRLKELEPLAAKARELEDAQKTEAERLQAQLADREQQIAKIRKQAVKSEVRSMAADLFADKTDPEAHLDLDGYVGDDGEIDTAQIKTDLADLLERKPHLGKPKPEPERRRPAPDRTQASGANQARIKKPEDDFASFIQTRLKRR